jgi:effector-binding domain-containing protein
LIEASAFEGDQEGNRMISECKAVDLPAQTALTIRTRTPARLLPNVLGQGFKEMAEYLKELDEEPAGPPFVAYYNSNMDDLEIEMGYPIKKDIDPKGVMEVREIPEGKYATCQYIGSYNQLEPAYKVLRKWIEENDYEPTGVVYEHYLNNPMETPESELKTQIAFALK